MNLITFLWGDSASHWNAVILALLHSLWQAGLVGLLLAWGLRSLAAERARLRAALAHFALVLVLLSFGVTWSLVHIVGVSGDAYSPQQLVQRPVVSDTTAPELVMEEIAWEQANVLYGSGQAILQGPHLAIEKSFSERASAWLRSWRPDSWSGYLGVLWLCGVLLMFVRTLADLAAGRMAVVAGVPVDDAWASMIQARCLQLGIRRPVRALWSDSLSVPAVYGLLRPALLLPTSLLQIPVEHVEAIVVHELAHIKRLDWLWGLIARVTESLLFFNPGVWWISRLASREREAAADRLALTLLDQPAEFARALVNWQGNFQRLPAMPAWTGDRGGLRDRVVRILRPTERPRVRLSPSGLLAASVAATVLLVTLWGSSRTIAAMAVQAVPLVKRLNEIQNAWRGISDPPAVDEQFLVTGKVRSADGSDVLGGCTLHVLYHSLTRDGSSDNMLTGLTREDGEFTREFSRMSDALRVEITLIADHPDFAPTILGPVIVPPGQGLTDLELTLAAGKTAILQLTGAKEAALASAVVEVQLAAPLKSNPRTYQANSQGVVSLTHVTDAPYDVTVTIPGFQPELFIDVDLGRSTPLVLNLTPIKPLEGIVVNSAGEPIAGAKVGVICVNKVRHGRNFQQTFGGAIEEALYQQESTAAGAFTVPRLSQQEWRVYVVTAAGYGGELFTLTPDMQDVRVELPPPRVLQGSVRGDLSNLAQDEAGHHLLEVEQVIEAGNGSTILRHPHVPLEMDANNPRLATFEIRDLLPAETILKAKSTTGVGDIYKRIPPFAGTKDDIEIEVEGDFRQINAAKQKYAQFQTRVAGTVRTSTGEPLPEIGGRGVGMVSVYLVSASGDNKHGYGLAISREEFSCSLGPVSGDEETVRIYVTAEWSGLAPTVLSPIVLRPGEDLTDLDLVLEPGFEGRIQLQSPDGLQIPEAVIHATTGLPAQSQPQQVVSDGGGVFVIPHAVTAPYRLVVLAPGYERQTFQDVKLRPDGIAELTLTPAVPVQGRVINDQGEPVAEARVLLSRTELTTKEKTSHYSYMGDGMPLLATSDEQGDFVLSSLVPDERTSVVIAADGRGRELHDVRAGDPPFTVQLGPERILRGRVVGDLAKLPGQKPVIGVTIQNHAKGVTLTPDENDPRLATFELRDLPPVPITLRIAGITKRIAPFSGLKDDVVIDLDHPELDAVSRRKVIVHFKPKNPQASLARGRLLVTTQSVPFDVELNREFDQQEIQIQDGKLELQSFAPGVVSFSPTGMIDQWFPADQLGTVQNYDGRGTATRGIHVPAGNDPLDVTIEVQEAGAVHGLLLGGTPELMRKLESIRVLRRQVERGLQAKRNVLGSLEVVSLDRLGDILPTGEFILTPVPYGDNYQLEVSFGVTKVFSDSDAIQVNAQSPISEVVLPLPEMVTGEVLVVDQQGAPVAGITVHYRRSYSDLFTTMSSGTTDDRGILHLYPLEKDHLDQYILSVIVDGAGKQLEKSFHADGKQTILTMPQDWDGQVR